MHRTGLLQQVQAIPESLISGQTRKPICPIVKNEIVDLFLLELSVQMPEKPDTNEFLVSKIRLGIITEALKTGVGTSIVNLTDKQIKLNQLIFHKQENSTNQPVYLSFQLLIRIL